MRTLFDYDRSREQEGTGEFESESDEDDEDDDANDNGSDGIWCIGSGGGAVKGGGACGGSVTIDPERDRPPTADIVLGRAGCVDVAEGTTE